KQGDTLIHLAAYVNLKNTEKILTEEINYTGTKTIANFCKENNVYLLFSSSVDAIYSQDYLIQEPSNLNPEKLNSIYQITKAKATNYILDLAKDNLKSFIIYPAAVIGINDYKPSPIGKEIKKCFSKRICLYFQGGYNFIDVKDVVYVIIKAIDNKTTGSVILSGYYVSLYRMYKLIFNSLNKKPIMIKIPLYLIKLISKVFPKYKVMIDALTSNHNYCNKKMQQEFNILPKPISKTILNTINWFKINEEI
ncbi:MAG: NAD-dependent epimerase/dehydratase family protein, partial [Candidatus Izemoplasmatales bacterium]